MQTFAVDEVEVLWRIFSFPNQKTTNKALKAGSLFYLLLPLMTYVEWHF